MPLIDPDTELEMVEKQPSEEVFFTMDFTDDLMDGDTLTGIDDVSAANQGKVSGSGPLNTPSGGSNQQIENDKQISYKTTGGTDGEKYKVTIKASTNLGEKLEGDMIVRVVDK